MSWIRSGEAEGQIGVGPEPCLKSYQREREREQKLFTTCHWRDGQTDRAKKEGFGRRADTKITCGSPTCSRRALSINPNI